MNRRYTTLGVRVDAIQIPGALATMEDWIEERTRCRYVAVTGMHGLAEARRDPAFKAILNAADLVVPDGMPLIWIGRLRGMPLQRRVYGPELMLSFCKQTAGRGYRHFLYGGGPGVAEKLSHALQIQCPGMNIVGTFSPPFRALTDEEEERVVTTINRSGCDIVWVGLSTPKQERWMHDHRDRLEAPVLAGVGAAFDIHAGLKKQAPEWMREHGLEWFFRLLQEPGRLWRRYIISGSQFMFYAALELLGLWRCE